MIGVSKHFPVDEDRMESLQSWWDLCHRRLDTDTIIRLPMLSGSMRPLLAPGTEIAIKPATWRDCQPGDIAVLHLGDNLTAHRLLLILTVGDRALCFQKGDMNPRGKWIGGRHIVGMVTESTDDAGSPHEYTSRGARELARQLASTRLRATCIDSLLAPAQRVWKLLRRR